MTTKRLSLDDISLIERLHRYLDETEAKCKRHHVWCGFKAAPGVNRACQQLRRTLQALEVEAGLRKDGE